MSQNPRPSRLLFGDGLLGDGVMEFNLLWQRFLALDPEAATELYDRYHGKVERLLSKLRFSPEAAEDLGQQCWLKVLGARSQFRGKSEGEFISWLLVLCRHSAWDARKKKTEVADSDFVEAQQEVGNEASTWSWQQWLAGLDPGDQQLIVHHVILEKSFEEISKEWDQPSSRLRQRFHRLRRKLQ
jgi:RNA polymerase sigma factor (sigma-70 family)